MTSLTWKAWLGIALVVVGGTILTWGGLNVVRTLYGDWAFWHQVRLNSEQQQAHPPK